ncbi:stage VI sporulation protein F [Cohnella nanjingensis]|uniref:Stage VI sporulation protein F n=1 Tax=Cohnella nanjingensis TaxID=1387779 RepID=A0A7X0RUZ1_9BACL|nr:stage VI sporulation protein F [Cohnella nanjingensis]MBB6674159.1 stage VI sporulation protein F [Cohnella nanjingensis]
MDKKLSKDILNSVNKKTGKSVSESSLKRIASKVTPETLQSETQIRQLIKQVSTTAGIPVSEDTVKEIVGAVKKSGLNMNSLEGLMKMMMKK